MIIVLASALVRRRAPSASAPRAGRRGWPRPRRRASRRRPMAIAGPMVSGLSRCPSTCTSERTVPMMPTVGAKPPACWKALAFWWWRPAMDSTSRSRMSLTSSGSVPSTTRRTPFSMNASSTACASSSSASRPSRRARSAMRTSVRMAFGRSMAGDVKARMYSFGMPMQRLQPDGRHGGAEGAQHHEQERRRDDDGGGVAALHHVGHGDADDGQHDPDDGAGIGASALAAQIVHGSFYRQPPART